MKNRVLMMIIVFVVMFSVCGCDSSDYKKANQLRDEKKYEQAYSIFSELNNYKDSEDLAVECCYFLGKEHYDKGKYREAYDYWMKCGDYKDSVDHLKNTVMILAQEYCQNEEYDHAIEILGTLPEDTAVVTALHQCQYLKADYLIRQKKYDEAEGIVNEIKNYMFVDDLVQACNYGHGVELYESKKYDEAVEKLLASNVGDDREKYLLVMAEDYKNKKNYNQVKKICSAIMDNKKAVKILKKVQMEEKYSRFRKKDTTYGSEQSMSKKETEQFLKENIYGEWRDYESGKVHNIDETMRDDRLYGIYAASKDTLIGWYYLYYFDWENPDKVYCEAWHEKNVVTERGGISQPFLESIEQEGFYTDEHAYGKMTESEIQDYLQSLPESKTPEEISDEERNTLYAQVKNDFNSYYKSQFSGTRGWYTTIQFPDIGGMDFEYDASAETCMIRFTATTCSNVFDFYGTSDSMTSVVAKYKRNGNAFTLVNILAE